MDLKQEHTGLTAGARAALELRLQEAKRELTGLQERRNNLMGQAEVQSALACEPGRRAARHNTFAVSLRLEALRMCGDITDAKGRVFMLEAMLADGPSPGGVLSAEQCAAVDETIGALA